MKKIEDLIRESMETHDPPEGHMERFNRRLEIIEQRQKNLRQIRPLLASAAAVSVLALCWWFMQLTGYRLFPGQNKQAGFPVEFAEADTYYRNILKNRMEQLRALPISDHQIRKSIDTELNEMEQSDAAMRQDLLDDPGNELIVQAMIEHYQNRLDILNKLIIQLSPLGKHTNSKAYENPGSTL
ncbi:MAG: hypothetical protein U0T82_14135 [Bacteroidales bacterium]